MTLSLITSFILLLALPLPIRPPATPATNWMLYQVPTMTPQRRPPLSVQSPSAFEPQQGPRSLARLASDGVAKGNWTPPRSSSSAKPSLCQSGATLHRAASSSILDGCPPFADMGLYKLFALCKKLRKHPRYTEPPISWLWMVSKVMKWDSVYLTCSHEALNYISPLQILLDGHHD